MDSKDNIEIGRFCFFGVFSFSFFEQNGNSVFAEVGLGEGAEVVEGCQDFAVFVVKADFFVDRVVIVDIGISGEDAEVGFFIFVGLFGLKFVLVGLDFEVVEEDDISDVNVKGQIFATVAPEIDLERVLGVGTIDDFEFLCEISVVFVAEGTGAVDDESDCRRYFLDSLLVFVLVLSELCEAL